MSPPYPYLARGLYPEPNSYAIIGVLHRGVYSYHGGEFHGNKKNPDVYKYFHGKRHVGTLKMYYDKKMQ